MIKFFGIKNVLCRVDPCAACEDKKTLPMEIAASRNDGGEMLRLMAEFTEIPDSAKIVELSKLMSLNYEVESEKEQFKNLLGTLPVDLVREQNTIF